MNIVRSRKKNVLMGRQWMNLLQKHPTFHMKDLDYPFKVHFYYDNPAEDNLKKLRKMFDLETIAGKGSELTRIINLMSWVYSLTGHANEPKIPIERNAFTLIHIAKIENQQINCYMKTVILNEIYLALGFYSRHTHLLPHSNEEEESHFITSVYSRSLEKWILMDPDFGVYVTDNIGNVLGVSEIRKYMIKGEPMKTIHIGRSKFEEFKVNLNNFIEGADYFWFLSDFIFKIRCPIKSMFNQESEPLRVFYELIPDNYREDQLLKSITTLKGKKIFYINHEDIFWQKPSLKNYPNVDN